MDIRVAMLYAASLAPSSCPGQEASPTEDAVADVSTTLDSVLVTGEYPGPGLWKVTHEGNGHVLWIVAQPPLLPSGITWRSREIETAAAQSQLIVYDGGFGIGVDGKVGFFRMLWVGTALVGIRNNPNGERLEEVVPATDYAKWRELRTQLGWKARAVEKWRPHFAADALVDEAIKAFRKDSENTVSTATTAGLWSTLRRIAKERSIKVTTSSYSIKIAPSEMRGIVKQFKHYALDDVECFSQSLAFSEALLSDPQRVKQRAKAWARGDLETLRRLPGLPRYQPSCNAALANSQIAARFEVGDLEARIHDQWMKTVEESIASNESTLALLPIDELLQSYGRLADLRAKGYVVEEPQ